MGSFAKNLLKITLISVVPTSLVWLPFFWRLESFWGIPLTRDGMATVVANFDGPLFIVVAKTLYNPEMVGNFPFDLPAIYYSAHYPMYPLLIRLVAPFTGYPYAMLWVTIAASVLAIYFFHKFIIDFVGTKNALWVTLVFALFPARWLIVRSVGSSEPLFLAAIIASVYYFRKEKFLQAGIWGVVAQLTKPPGILLFIAYFLALFIPKFKSALLGGFASLVSAKEIKKYLSISLIPLSLVSLFIFYGFRFGDFFAYFNSGDNIHLFFPPFQIFDYSQPWVGTFWLEEVLFVYLFGLLGVVKLIKMKEYKITWFVGIFFMSILFVSHRDIIRYSLPIVPFLIAAFSDTIVKKEFKWIMFILIIPIYLYSLAYISQNVMPIPDWAPLL